MMGEWSARARMVAGAVLVSVGAAAGISGCASGGPSADPGPEADFPRPSDVGRQAYLGAMWAWAEAVAEGGGEESRGEAISEVIELLDTGIHNDPYFPLYKSKLADVLLEERGVRQAFEIAELYRASLDDSQDWVPAWIGLARLELARAEAGGGVGGERHVELALEALGNAERAIRTISGEAKQELIPNNPFGWWGQGGELPPPEDTTGGHVLLTSSLIASEAWRIDNSTILDLGRDMGPSTAVLDPGAESVLDALRGEVAYQRARIAEASYLEASDRARAYDEVFRYDPNHLDARIAQAGALTDLGRFEAAQAILEPRSAQGNRLVMRYPPFLIALQKLYTWWYEQSLQTAHLERAYEVFVLLTEGEAPVAPDLPDPYLLATRMYAAAAVFYEDEANLRLAEERLGDALQRGAPARSYDAARVRVDRAHKELRRRQSDGK